MNEILKKFKKIFCRKKRIKFIDLANSKDVSKNRERYSGRISIPKDDDTLGSFTDYSDIAP